MRKAIIIILIVLFFLLSFFLTIRSFQNVHQSVNVNVTTEQKNKINLNTASEKQLESLPGIGEKRAKLITQYIRKNKINSVDDLRNIKGIGDEIIQNLKSEVCVE